MKAKIYNLIILDESGSMCGVTRQTIDGCNETINTILMAQGKNADTQEHFISIFAFQANGSKPSRYLIKNAPAANAKHINAEQYTPWGATPLYDAVGSTLADLKAVTQGEELAIGSVTIITDGMENASTHYTLQKVAKMIEALKELGWNFNFIGANIDVKATAQSFNIDNTLEFDQDEEGTRIMFEKERKSRMSWIDRTSNVMACCADRPDEDFRAKMREASADYFEKADEEV